jgi:hypothetical protein
VERLQEASTEGLVRQAPLARFQVTLHLRHSLVVELAVEVVPELTHG